MSDLTHPLRVAIIGTARRSSYLYGPILAALPDNVQLVSVWGRSAESARQLGESLNTPWYTDMDKLMRETAPQIGIVSVTYGANGEVGLMALDTSMVVNCSNAPRKNHVASTKGMVRLGTLCGPSRAPSAGIRMALKTVHSTM